MNTTRLAERLQNPDCLGLSDQEAADVLNAATVTGSLVPLWKIKQHLYESRAWGFMRIAEQTTEDQNLKALLLTAFDYFSDTEFQNLDLDLTSIKDMFASLLAAKLITQNDMNAIEAMRPVTPYPETIGFPKVGPHHVAAARGVL
jgi:hypothetical protein